VAPQSAKTAALAAPAAPSHRAQPFDDRAADPDARLRAAAAAGRTAELTALLDEGVPVDAPDAEGDTALIKSVRADHPAAAALLRRHGASLDRRNQAGESARDIAAGKADPDLDRALGVAR
jgi:ankyrin repeat protein